MISTAAEHSTGPYPARPETVSSGGLSVVVCAFTFARLELTVRAVASILDQDPAPDEVLVVIDHNEPLRAALAERIRGATVIPSEGPPGLSGARNTGLAHSVSELVAFVDDDAEAAPGWSSAITAPFSDGSIVAVGGIASPCWDGGAPGWFPDELLWAVGCSYRGMATKGAIRNPLGCNMAFRSGAVRRAGLFDPALGRLGTLPFGCEETDLSIRLRHDDPSARMIIAPAAVVRHHVPPERSTLRYLWQRSYYEGIGKAMLRRAADSGALSTERSYALKVLPRAVAHDLVRMASQGQWRRRSKRIAAITGSLSFAGLGYLVGLVRHTSGPAVEAQRRIAS